MELLVLRKSLARELLPDGKIGAASSHPYYEVCTSPKLYDLVAALIRTKAHAGQLKLSAPNLYTLIWKRKGSGDLPGLQSRRFGPSRVEWWVRLPHASAISI